MENIIISIIHLILSFAITIFCYKQIYNPLTRRYGDKIEIGYTEYQKLGGEEKIQDFIVRHMD